MKKTILVVDDEAISRELLREILTPEGYAVLEAQDGREALEQLEKNAVDLMITDRQMPGMDGMTLLKELKARKRKVPALMVSAYGEDSFWGEAVGLGALDYVTKPFKPDEVLKIVAKGLKGGKAA